MNEWLEYATNLPDDCTLSHNATCALVWLAASKFDGKARCAPAIGTLAKRARLSYDSMARGIAELERAGIIRRTARTDGGRKMPNVYTFRKIGGK